MAATTKTHNLPVVVERLVNRPPHDNRPVVVMTCGIAGSGKSTLAKSILSRFPNFQRLSVDEIVFEKHGIYGIDYPANQDIYQAYLEEADTIYRQQFEELLGKGRDIILDRSFYAQEDRREFSSMIESRGARKVLVFFRPTDKEKLWGRICARSAQKKDANSALDISRDIFELYWAGFEAPSDEGEIILEV